MVRRHLREGEERLATNRGRANCSKARVAMFAQDVGMNTFGTDIHSFTQMEAKAGGI